MTEPNLYFFRDEVGYEPDEIARRIQIEDLRDRPDPVEDILAETDLDESILENSKPGILAAISRRVSPERYDEFMQSLLDAHGEKGDRANFQIYKINDLDREALLQKLDEGDPDNVTLSKVSRYRELNGALDIRFKDQTVGEYISRDELELVGGSSDNISLEEVIEQLDEETLREELGIEDVNAAREAKDITYEARVYTDFSLVFISNRRISDKMQTNIRDGIADWGDADAHDIQNLELRETELLYFQNVMGGENSGLDFGDFVDHRVGKAKYRGPRQESLTRSPVLQPAQTEGQITQVRYYYSYDDWMVQIRLHRDAHVTTSKPTRPDFADEIRNHLNDILEDQSFLDPIDDLISTYSAQKQRKEVRFNERSYRKRRKAAFDDLVGKYILDDSYRESEKQVFGSLLANIAISLGELDLGSAGYPTPDELDEDEYPSKQKEIETFLTDYFTFELERPAPDIDQLLKHLHHCMTNLAVQPVDSPLDIVNNIDGEYGIRN